MPKMKRPKPHPKWGATKAQAARNAVIRDLKGQIFQLMAVNRDLGADNTAKAELVKTHARELTEAYRAVDELRTTIRHLDEVAAKNATKPTKIDEITLKVLSERKERVTELTATCNAYREILLAFATGKVAP